MSCRLSFMLLSLQGWTTVIALPRPKGTHQITICPKFGSKASDQQESPRHFRSQVSSLAPCCFQNQIQNPCPDFQSSPWTGSEIHHWLNPTLQPCSHTEISTLELLQEPPTKYKTRGGKSFQGVAPCLWNKLPLSLHSLDCVENF